MAATDCTQVLLVSSVWGWDLPLLVVAEVDLEFLKMVFPN